MTIFKIFKGSIDYQEVIMLLNLGTALVMKLEDDFRAGQKIVIVVESKYLVPQLKALIQQYKGFVNCMGLSILD